MNNGELIKCQHGYVGWCGTCSRTRKQTKELNLASNMTTRQAFAMAAMQGMLANPDTDSDYDILASFAIEAANAMLKALEGQQSSTESELIGGDHGGVRNTLLAMEMVAAFAAEG